MKNRNPKTRSWLVTCLFALLLSISLLTNPSVVFAASPAPAASVTVSPLAQQLAGIVGRAHTTQDPTWIQRKLAFQVQRPGYRPLAALSTSLPTTNSLDVTYSEQISEPPPSGYDKANMYYTDNYFVDFCAPGATDVAMTYWAAPPNLSYGQHTYTDPSYAYYHIQDGQTTWNDTNYQSYLMYIADQVMVPGWKTPGEVTFDNNGVKYTPGAANTFPADLRDTMNWEASGHASNYSSYFYVWVPASANITLTQLQHFIEQDVDDGVAPVANVKAALLPSWTKGGNVGHSVAIVGYDNTSNNTLHQPNFSYIETCTTVVCGTTGTGWYQIPQSQLLTAIQSDPQPGDGGIVW
jgi:hypothetical protein